MTANVLPISTPSRSELWRRQQLARSLIAHRGYTRETAELVQRALDGDDIDTLIHPQREEVNV